MLYTELDVLTAYTKYFSVFIVCELVLYKRNDICTNVKDSNFRLQKLALCRKVAQNIL
jgi:hypothetical protein